MKNYHNPMNVPESAVPAGWEMLTAEEVKGRQELCHPAEVLTKGWIPSLRAWGEGPTDGCNPYITYITKRVGSGATRKPDETAMVGWICPVCGRGNAIWNATCPCQPLHVHIKMVPLQSNPVWESQTICQNEEAR